MFPTIVVPQDEFPTFRAAPEFARMLLLADFLDVPAAFAAACRAIAALDRSAVVAGALLATLPDAVRRRREFASSPAAEWIRVSLRERFERPMIDDHIGCLTVEAFGILLEWDELHVGCVSWVCRFCGARRK